jgi:hypothetical protein
MKLIFFGKMIVVIIGGLLGTSMLRAGAYVSLFLWITAFSVILAKNTKWLDRIKAWHKGVIFVVLVIASFALL